MATSSDAGGEHDRVRTAVQRVAHLKASHHNRGRCSPRHARHVRRVAGLVQVHTGDVLSACIREDDKGDVEFASIGLCRRSHTRSQTAVRHTDDDVVTTGCEATKSTSREGRDRAAAVNSIGVGQIGWQIRKTGYPGYAAVAASRKWIVTGCADRHAVGSDPGKVGIDDEREIVRGAVVVGFCSRGAVASAAAVPTRFGADGVATRIQRAKCRRNRAPRARAIYLIDVRETSRQRTTTHGHRVEGRCRVGAADCHSRDRDRWTRNVGEHHDIEGATARAIRQARVVGRNTSHRSSTAEGGDGDRAASRSQPYRQGRAECTSVQRIDVDHSSRKRRRCRSSEIETRHIEGCRRAKATQGHRSASRDRLIEIGVDGKVERR